MPMTLLHGLAQHLGTVLCFVGAVLAYMALVLL